MNFRFAVVILFLLTAHTLAAEDYSGRVIDEREQPVAFATVILLELDLIETSGEDGSFSFIDAAPGSYTLLVIAPGYLEWEGAFDADADEMIVVLSPAVVEMDTIVVIAEDDLPEEILDNEVAGEELERLPPRSDPFDAITQESGVLIDANSGASVNWGGGSGGTEPGEPISIELESGALGRAGGNRPNRVAVYGGESDWNNYYYDYIRIPTNTHAFGYPVSDPIVPVSAVDAIGIYKGVIPVERGPAIGGLFALEPAKGSQEFDFTFTPSIMDVSLLAQWPLSDNLSLLVSLNQSIVQYTILPIVAALVEVESEEEVNEEGDPTSFMYGDALLRLVYTPPRHSLSFDVLAYYDRWLFDIAFEDFKLSSEYGPYYAAAGSKWNYSPASTVTNSLYLFGSYFNDFGNYDFRFPTTISFGGESETDPEAFYDLHIDWLSNVTSVQAGDELLWNILPSTSLLFGANARLAVLDGSYTEIILQTDAAGAELSNEVLELPGIDELSLTAYGYAKVLGQSDILQYNAGAGLLWYPTTGAVRPSVNGEVVYIGDKLVTAFGAGWSPGVIDEFSYIDRRLDEQYYQVESATDLSKPPMGVTTALQLAYPVTEKQEINISPYFAWYYDLSGIAANTSGNGSDGGYISYDPSKGYSTGIDIGWKGELSDSWDLSLSYAFSHTRYHTQEWGWVAPNSEVMHALKSGLLCSNGRFKVGQNLLIYSGIPFTPEIVARDPLGEIVFVQEDYNSAIDYVPRFDVRTNISYSWYFNRFDLSAFYNSSNWLDIANGAFQGIKPEKQEVIGTSSATFANREYVYSLDWTDILINFLLADFGVSFSF